ncbi:putative uncharacterized protein [Waddlia chondrophila 2032/99]|uniref:Uncharacterized protein n=1 Tax=Waddlia chondrophila 2032/99 TaxID=765953 RepID=F8LED2_9BACT|nr:putative uncharacterized protein [Waddlia chondrophila 2032/99]
MKFMQGKYLRIFLFVFAVSVALYGGGRLWFHFTDGFRIAHITSNFKPDPRWEIRKLNLEEEKEVAAALSQSYIYLGKGCQSYAFESEDGHYVLKFLKYKRYRPQFYFYLFTFLPEFQKYLDRKIEEKKKLLDVLFTSWSICFDQLPQESAMVYLHLNKSNHLNKRIVIQDKIGREHQLEMDDMEFMIQRKGEMLCPTIDRMMAEGRVEEAKKMLSGLFQIILNEYRKGLADMDHALMQNTAVADQKAFQLDVGQFVADPIVSNPDFYHQEIFNKYDKFRKWLGKNHPSLAEHVNNELVQEMGEKFHTMRYIPNPNQF